MEYVNGGEVSGYTLYLKLNFIVLLCYQPRYVFFSLVNILL